MEKCTLKSIHEILEEMASNYKQKIPKDSHSDYQLDIEDLGKSFSIEIRPQNTVSISEKANPDAKINLMTNSNIIQKISHNEISALTALGRANISDSAPINFRTQEGITFSMELYYEIVEFIQRFFNYSYREKTFYGEEYSRNVHGAGAVPFFYDKGFRSAWFLIKKGEKLNEPGDTNPFPQSLIVIAGSGYGNLGGDRISIKKGEVYYIPPDTDHVLWTENESLEIIWLAWGQGA